jgi:hypothetical protein
MRIWYDTEFIQRGSEVPLRLISIGMVREDGAEYYAINGDLSPADVYRVPFLLAEVWPHLPMKVEGDAILAWDETHPDYVKIRTQDEIRIELHEFMGLDEDEPELWADYSAYDHVVMTQLFGPFEDRPDHLPMRTNDLEQHAETLGTGYPVMFQGRPHHALDDAKAVKAAWEWITKPRTAVPASGKAVIDHIKKLSQ